jgi:sialate O-acetylesterase
MIRPMRAFIRLLSLSVAVIACVPVLASGRADSTLTLGPLFQDHAVLQRGRPIPIWGTAAPRGQVTISFAGQEATARADRSGYWTATLPALEAGGPYSLEAHDGTGATLTLADILVGDVFLCSGQSNMALTVAQSRGGGFVAARSANDRLRLATIAHVGKPAPVSAFDTAPTWEAADPKSVGPFSAACYFFGKEIQETRKVPVGLIHASWGGTAIEPWIGESGLRAIPGFDPRLDILREYAHDEDAANRAYGKLWEDWWRQHGSSAGAPWSPAEPGSWTDVPALTNWKTWGVPELATHDGMVWYRRSFTLTAAQAAGEATLSLGGIDEVDETWVNGHAIRNTFGWGTPRTYQLPAGTLRAGDNVIIVNVLSTWDAGGMTGPADAIALTPQGGAAIPLGDGWQYRTVPLAMGRPPRAPWETIAGLTTLYNGMIAPMGPFAIRGVAWYQGESNADAPDGYDRLLGALMASWRAQFGADLPFLIVQLPDFGPVPTQPTDAGWSELREAQRRAVMADAHAGLVVTIDIGEPDNLHPGDKRDVGLRLARAARHVFYGEDVPPSGPVPLSARRDPAGVIVLFGDVDGSLVTYSANVAIGFELCDSGPGSCRYVAGTVDGNRIVLPVPEAAGWRPVRVRFCWGPSPVCNLADASKLPAGPFEIRIE